MASTISNGRHHMQIFGVCPDCLNQRPSPQEVFDSDAVSARDALKSAMEAELQWRQFLSWLLQSSFLSLRQRRPLAHGRREKKHLRDLEFEWIELLKKDKNILKAPYSAL